MKRIAQAALLLLSVIFSRGQAAIAEVPVIAVENKPVIVFAHTERCEPLDIPDAPLRAFRRADGMVVAFATHFLNRAAIGPSLSHLSHDCQLVYQGKHLADPAQFDDRTWITSTWTSDGITVSALGHNEYHGEQFVSHCRSKTIDKCWYISVVPLVSSDGGRSFVRTHYPTPIAAPPMKVDEDRGQPQGYVIPSNIIFNDGYYYALIGRTDFDGKKAGRCLFRTQDVLGPDTWTVWDGHSYLPIFGSPYDNHWTYKPICEAATGLSGALGSIAKLKNTKFFVAFWIAESDSPEGGRYKCLLFGRSAALVWHSTSSWRHTRVVHEMPSWR